MHRSPPLSQTSRDRPGAQEKRIHQFVIKNDQMLSELGDETLYVWFSTENMDAAYIDKYLVQAGMCTMEHRVGAALVEQGRRFKPRLSINFLGRFGLGLEVWTFGYYSSQWQILEAVALGFHGISISSWSACNASNLWGAPT